MVLESATMKLLDLPADCAFQWVKRQGSKSIAEVEAANPTLQLVSAALSVVQGSPLGLMVDTTHDFRFRCVSTTLWDAMSGAKDVLNAQWNVFRAF